MLVKAPKAYERPNFSLGLENNFRRQTSRTYFDTVYIGKFYLVKCSMFRFLLNHTKLLLIVNDKVIILCIY